MTEPRTSGAAADARPYARVLITGAAGFIGFHTAQRFLATGAQVLGVDNFSPYYDVALKEARSEILARSPQFSMTRIDIADKAALDEAWGRFAPDLVVHLAAQAGVRHSISHPDAYISANLIGTFNILEAARQAPPRHLLAASTSSVYGANEVMPFRETDKAVHPLTLYAATKAGAEHIGHAYAHIFKIPTTFFRFFTVYGPWGRPDMALFKFAKAMLEGEPIDVYNNGQMVRDFTYVDDLVEGVVRLAGVIPGEERVAGDSLSPVAPFRVVNIGQGQPVNLLAYIDALEKALGVTAEKRMLPMQTGDVPATEASVDLLKALTGFTPSTSVAEGVPRFVEWYRTYRGA